MKRSHWTLLTLLLLVPLILELLFMSNIHNLAQRIFIRYRFTPANILIKDILFIEGLFLIIFGVQSSEYIWRYFRNRKNKGLHEQPAEFGVGSLFLIFGAIYILTALIIP